MTGGSEVNELLSFLQNQEPSVGAEGHLRRADPVLARLIDDYGLYAEVFNLASEEVTSEQRRYAKTINFGLIYGMGAYGLSQSLGIEQKAAKSYIERYFSRNPPLARSRPL